MKSNINPFLIYFLLTCLVVNVCSCKKEWISAKPDKALVVPEALKDMQALMDNYSKHNTRQRILGELGTDNFSFTDANLNRVSVTERNSFLWQEDIFEGSNSIDWAQAYESIFYCNIVLEGLEKIAKTQVNKEEFDNIKGQALFFRAWHYFYLAQIFCKPFDAATASTDLGLPLRVSSDINQKIGRSSISQTYDRILGDIFDAKEYLKETQSVNSFYRPDKAAVFGFLARIYLAMEHYSNAKLYADSCLQSKSGLLDYNNLNPNASNPIPSPTTGGNNPELIFNSYSLSTLTAFYVNSNSTLYNSYDQNDLRRTIFFTSTGNRFKGNYYFITTAYFNGIATDEIYLIRAECLAREGNIQDALYDLNTLMEKRWVSGQFTPITANSADEALEKILIERRKELCFRGLRWEDLRRLNRDSRFATLIIRTYNGLQYELLPNSNRYIYPIPPDEILYGGLEQNIR